MKRAVVVEWNALAFMGVRTYTVYMTILTRTSSASFGRKLVIDCRSMDFAGPSEQTADSVLAWVMSFPAPKEMHVLLPSSAPQVRRLQCTLQGMGCGVSRVTKYASARLN